MGLSELQMVDPYSTRDVTQASIQVCAVPCRVYATYFANVGGAAARFVKLYDKVGAVNPASDVPAIVIALGAATAVNNADRRSHDSPINFKNGLAIRCSTGQADTDTGAPGAANVLGDIEYVRGNT